MAAQVRRRRSAVAGDVALDRVGRSLSGPSRPSRSTPDMRVCAGKRHEHRYGAPPGRARAARISPSPARRSSVLRRLVRPETTTARRRRSPPRSRQVRAGTRRLPVPSVIARSCRAAASARRPPLRRLGLTPGRCAERAGSMPAIPIADSSPPIVVGIRQTSSDTSTKHGIEARPSRRQTAAA